MEVEISEPASDNASIIQSAENAVECVMVLTKKQLSTLRLYRNADIVSVHSRCVSFQGGTALLEPVSAKIDPRRFAATILL